MVAKTRTGMFLTAVVAAAGMAACAAPRATEGQAPPVQSMKAEENDELTGEEKELVRAVLHAMLDATTPDEKKASASASPILEGDGSLTVRVCVYDRRQYDAAVAIVRMCAHRFGKK